MDPSEQTAPTTNGKPAACRRCKELKARCDRTHLHPCSRCVRLQIPCDAGAPSQQGKRKRPTSEGGQQQIGSSAAADTADTWTIEDLVNFGRDNLSIVCRSDWHLVIAFIRGACDTAQHTPLSRAFIASALRKACMFATPGENPSLLGTVASAAAWFGVPEAIQPQKIRECMDTPPAAVTAYLRSRPSPSYAIARCFGTRRGACATDAFYRDICPLDRMIEWLECNRGGSMTSLFMPAEDTCLIPEAGGRLMAQAATIAHPTTCVRVRVLITSTTTTTNPSDSSPRTTACQAECRLLTNHHFGAADTWFGVELIPLAELADSAGTSESNPMQSEDRDEGLDVIASVHELMDAFGAYEDTPLGLAPSR